MTRCPLRESHTVAIVDGVPKKSGQKSAKGTKIGPVGRGTAMPGRHGGTLYAGIGRGPAKGAPNAGRPRDQWAQTLRELADREAVLGHVDAALKAGPRRPLLDEDGWPIDRDGQRLAEGKEPIYIGSTYYERALDYATDHGYGRATQPIAHSGSVGLVDLLEQAHAKVSGK